MKLCYKMMEKEMNLENVELCEESTDCEHAWKLVEDII